MTTQPMDSKTILKTYYDGPDNDPVEETFCSLQEAMQLASSRTKEGLTVMVERVSIGENAS
jgi:hypothetical protein